MPAIGDSFQLGEEGHLWIIITNISPGGKFIMVNITSRENTEDMTCILDPGDHPFIKHPSAVNYKDIREADCASLVRGLAYRGMIRHDPVSPRVLRRIQDGALTTVRRKFRSLIESSLAEAT